MSIYGYYVNLFERGSFLADVRNEDGQSILEVRGGAELGEDETSLIDDGYMRHFHDLAGLKDYLVGMGAMLPNDQLLPSPTFEARLQVLQSAVPVMTDWSVVYQGPHGVVEAQYLGLASGMEAAERLAEAQGIAPLWISNSQDPGVAMTEWSFDDDEHQLVHQLKESCGFSGDDAVLFVDEVSRLAVAHQCLLANKLSGIGCAESDIDLVERTIQKMTSSRGIGVDFRDPRGSTVALHLPNGASNSFGGGWLVSIEHAEGFDDTQRLEALVKLKAMEPDDSPAP